MLHFRLRPPQNSRANQELELYRSAGASLERQALAAARSEPLRAHMERARDLSPEQRMWVEGVLHQSAISHT